MCRHLEISMANYDKFSEELLDIDFAKIYGAKSRALHETEREKRPISESQLAFIDIRLKGLSNEQYILIFEIALNMDIGPGDFPTSLFKLSWHKAKIMINYIRSPRFRTDLRNEGRCRDIWSSV